MHYKTSRQNHDFQLAYFLAGSCRTPDAAWSLLYDQRSDREDALKLYESAKLRERAKRVAAERRIASNDEVEMLEGQADLLEIEAMADTTRRSVEGAQAELAMIEKIMNVLDPMRRFKHLPDAEAHEAAQREEWKHELINRAENFIMTQGTIPADEFNTMRMHPDFKTDILPALTNVKALVLSRDPNAIQELRALQDRPRAFSLPDVVAALPDYVSGKLALPSQ